MAEATPQSSAVGVRDRIVEKAKELAIKYKDSSYFMGGQGTSAFDCSYFVYLVLHEIFPDYTYCDSAAIASSFKKGKG